MTTSEYAGTPRLGSGLPTAYERGSDADRASRFWRTVWRTHFYAGMFSMPILILLSITGLIILYTQPITEWIHGDLTSVSVGAVRRPLDDQRAVVAQAFPGGSVDGVTPPSEPDQSTKFAITTDDGSVRQAYVDPYTNEVLGSMKDGDDIIGLSNRLHGQLNNATVSIPLPTLAGLLGKSESGGLTEEVPIGDVIIEVFAVWALVLALTGLYLWRPRKEGTGRPRFVPRLRKQGRGRWRDLHALSGILLSGLLIFFVITGLPWSAYWGGNWYTAANEMTPAKSGAPAGEAPGSTLAKTGDLDRYGNRIPWAAAQNPVAASETPPEREPTAAPDDNATTGSTDPVPAALSLAAIQKIAVDEGMRAGYSIAFPVDDVKAKPVVYGTYVLTNPWPSRVGAERTYYIDQFSGKTLDYVTPGTLGGVYAATEWGINTHMGTQFGLASRIAMTAACLLIFTSALTALVMWWKRRPKGTAGAPRRPADAAIPATLVVLAIVAGIVYPLWGATALLVLAFDRFVIRRTPRLRRAFGMY